MLVNLLGGSEGREFDLACLNEPADTALVPEVGTAQHRLPSRG